MKKVVNILILSILGGMSIGLGGTIFLSLDDKVIGSALFSVGLFVILTFNFNLYTGKICFITKDTISNIPIIWIGNYIGTLILSTVIYFTRIYSNINTKAISLWEVKQNDSMISLFLLGLLCNIFIYISVYGYKNNPHEIGKYISILLGVMGFILCGTEHCVADMFYMNISGLITIDSIIRLIVITLGNTVGGILISKAHCYTNKK